jgi:hypothetical protein
VNRSDPVRLPALPQLRLAATLLAAIGIGAAFILIFLPPLQAKFTSDTFYLYERTWAQSPSDLVALFVPRSDMWYRPVTDSVMWLEARAFGQDPIGYHLVALTSHIVSTALIFLLAERLTRSRKASLLAALIFLVNPHAQQPLWDISVLHVVLSTPIVLASLLAYISGRRIVAWLVAGLAVLVDESGLLAIAIIGLYELIVARHVVDWSSLRGGLLRLTPFAAIAAGYLAMRILTGIHSEISDPCRTPKCLVVAAGEYFNRFLVRPDLPLNSLWTHRWVYVALGLLVVALVMLLTRPWAWREKRIPAFAVAWLVVATSFFILSLWPYVTDRFLYVTDCALAVLIGVVAVRASDARPKWSAVRKWASYAAVCVLAAWIAAGPWMLLNRGQLNIDAGEKDASILREIHAMVPDPPPGAVFVVGYVPVMASSAIPPGNDGPYLFNSGLDSAIRLEYGRSDLTVVVLRGGSSSAPAGAFVFEIRDGSVVRMP